MTKKDKWDKTNIILMCLFTFIIALGTAFIAVGTYKLAFKDVEQIKKDIQNLSISRGRCLTPNALWGIVKFNGVPAKSAIISITNINTGDTKILTTNDKGEYAESAGNFPNCWVGGDKVKINACVSNECNTKEIVFTLDNGGIRVDFNI